jgi:hypothetical protein
MTLHYAISFIYKILLYSFDWRRRRRSWGVPSHPSSIPEIRSEEKEWIIIILS